MSATKDMKKFIRHLNNGDLPWDMENGKDTLAKDPIFKDCARVQELPEDFAPGPEYVEFLELHHNIPVNFTMEQLAEFKLYWIERGEKRKAWQSKFKNHVIYQWKKQSGARQVNKEPVSVSSPDRQTIAAMLLQGLVSNTQDVLHSYSKQEELVCCAIEMTDLLMDKLDNDKKE